MRRREERSEERLCWWARRAGSSRWSVEGWSACRQSTTESIARSTAHQRQLDRVGEEEGGLTCFTHPSGTVGDGSLVSAVDWFDALGAVRTRSSVSHRVRRSGGWYEEEDHGRQERGKASLLHPPATVMEHHPLSLRYLAAYTLTAVLSFFASIPQTAAVKAQSKDLDKKRVRKSRITVPRTEGGAGGIAVDVYERIQADGKAHEGPQAVHINFHGYALPHTCTLSYPAHLLPVTVDQLRVHPS